MPGANAGTQAGNRYLSWGQGPRLVPGRWLRQDLGHQETKARSTHKGNDASRAFFFCLILSQRRVAFYVINQHKYNDCMARRVFRRPDVFFVAQTFCFGVAMFLIKAVIVSACRPDVFSVAQTFFLLARRMFFIAGTFCFESSFLSSISRPSVPYRLDSHKLWMRGTLWPQRRKSLN